MSDAPDTARMPASFALFRSFSGILVKGKLMRASIAIVAALLTSPLVAADAKEKSGCQPGEKLRPFDVLDVTGKYKPSSVCYI